MAIDARIRYTKNVIRESFLSLRAKKSIERITVRELCDLAEINRATFYKYYRDIYDLNHQLEEEMLEAACALVHKSDLTRAYDIILMLTQSMYEKRDRYLALRGFNNYSLIQRLTARTFEDKCAYFAQVTQNPNMTENRWHYHFMCSGAAAVMMNWVADGMQEPPEQVAAALDKLIQSCK